MTQAVLDYITNALANQIMGFGTFEIHEKAARLGRDPQNGKE